METVRRLWSEPLRDDTKHCEQTGGFYRGISLEMESSTPINLAPLYKVLSFLQRVILRFARAPYQVSNLSCRILLVS